ncbi:putative ATPase [Desulfitispora alkaliphila]|uniref:AAA family ATPase n=1 Tax=Desulfitispora alkaliphila TaxID=622674 RepID=UPI003D245D2C
MINKLGLRNYKSFHNIELQLNNFCVFIGSNGSGKSNLIDSLKFLKESLNSNVGHAVGNRFGWKNLLSKGRRSTEKIEIELEFMLDFIKFRSNEQLFQPSNSSYYLQLAHTKNNTYIHKEALKTMFEMESVKTFSQFDRTKNIVKVNNNHEELSPTSIKEDKLELQKNTNNKLFLDANFVSIANLLLGDLISNWKFYNIDHNLARKPSNSENDQFLEEDASNLAIMLQRLQSDKAVKDRIKSLMKAIIPSFDTWKVERQFDASLGYKIVENEKDVFLPKMISDGTIRLLSILVAILFQDKETNVITIDEPERCLHPQSLQVLVEVMREVSKNKQILVTTHSAEIVKWLKPEEIYLVDKIEGQTRVVPGFKIEKIEEFLTAFSMEELWLSGYLKGGTIR